MSNYEIYAVVYCQPHFLYFWKYATSPESYYICLGNFSHNFPKLGKIFQIEYNF